MKISAPATWSESGQSWIRRVLSPGQTLQQRVVRGGIWLFALRGTRGIIHLARTTVLARFLSPDDLGLIGIALLTMSVLQTFSQTGFQVALVQKKEDIEDYLDTAWTVSAVRGLLLFVVFYSAAPYIGLFFDTSPATPLMRVIGVSLLFEGLTNIGVIYFQKELEFNRQVTYQLSGEIADLLVVIAAAVLLRNAWALVLGLLVGNLVRASISYLVHPYRPTFKFDWEKASEMLGFGKYVFMQSIVLFLLTQGDDAFVGKMLGTTALGYYQLAYQFSNMAATEITHVVSRVAFPAYSKLQDQKDKLKSALSKTLDFVTLVSLPLASGILILAPEFTKVFFGEKWMPMVPAMQVMCLFGAMRSVAAAFGPVYRAVARIDIPLKINLSQLVLLVPIIYLLSSSWGILGTAVAITLSMVVALYLTSREIIGILDVQAMSLFEFPLIATVSSGGMVLVVLLVKTYVLNGGGIISLIALVGLGVTSYLSALFVSGKVVGYDLMASIEAFRGQEGKLESFERDG